MRASARAIRARSKHRPQPSASDRATMAAFRRWISMTDEQRDEILGTAVRRAVQQMQAFRFLITKDFPHEL